jgi:hypothetical protein
MKVALRAITRCKRRYQVRELYIAFLGEVYGTNFDYYAAKRMGLWF